MLAENIWNLGKSNDCRSYQEESPRSAMECDKSSVSAAWVVLCTLVFFLATNTNRTPISVHKRIYQFASFLRSTCLKYIRVTNYCDIFVKFIIYSHCMVIFSIRRSYCTSQVLRLRSVEGWVMLQKQCK